MQYDVIAGVSIAFMVIPQGISYATAGGLPSVYGKHRLATADHTSTCRLNEDTLVVFVLLS